MQLVGLIEINRRRKGQLSSPVKRGEIKGSATGEESEEPSGWRRFLPKRGGGQKEEDRRDNGKMKEDKGRILTSRLAEGGGDVIREGSPRWEDDISR